jgi:uncharacterized protein
MVEIITYALRDGQKYSDKYYRDIADFTDEVLAEIRTKAENLINDYTVFIQKNGFEVLRSFDEYAFELLMLGTLWRTYINGAVRLGALPQQSLATLGKYRKRYRLLKPAIDWLRGLLGTIYLTSKNGKSHQTPDLSLENLTHLLEWVEATGEFGEETKRLKHWRNFLGILSPKVCIKSLKMAIKLATWFEASSLEVLGKYTQNVDSFLKEKHPAYRWREDIVFCGRQRVEYHLNMVGAEILNRSFQAEFLQTERKIVLLPPCMKARPEDKCKAEDTPLGQRCAACTPGCRVHQTTKLGEKHGFAVFIMPHELSVFSNGNMQPTRDPSVGIVGVSCPLTIVPGGWETHDLGVPAQGVLLDYCGCPWHWHEEGIPTEINFKQLLKVIGVKELNKV